MWQYRSVVASLSERGVVLRKTDPYPDGRDKYEVYCRNGSGGRYHSDDPEHCYNQAIKHLL